MFNTFYKTFMVRFTSMAVLLYEEQKSVLFFAFFFCLPKVLYYINHAFDDDDGVFLSRFPVIFNIIIHLLTLFFLSLSSKIKSNTSVYVGVIIAGALVGEKMVNKGFDSMWESRNKGKLFKDLKLPEAEEE